MLYIVLILSVQLTIAQANYTEHPIQKGENIYRISKKYGVSMDAIFELNPGSETAIYPGDTLRIPKSETTTTNSSIDNTPISDSKISNYRVKRGETKFSLSKRFGVTIAFLEQQNPHIVPALQAGQLINLNKSTSGENIQAELSSKKGEHLVVKGETLWSISRKYGIEFTQLKAANSHQLSDVLYIGQTLIIPNKNIKTHTSADHNNDGYMVKPGDTKYSLAKRFNMSITELESKNPHIVNMLMSGHILNVGDNDSKLTQIENTKSEVSHESSVVQTETSTSDDNNSSTEKYETYIIQPKETLYSLSQKAGMTIEAFTKLNPKLKSSVISGHEILMPISETKASQDTEVATITSDEKYKTPTVNTVNQNAQLYNNLITESANGLYFYSPVSIDDIKSEEQRQNLLTTNKDFQKYIDFFQGAQMAIDSAKALNLKFDVTLIKRNIGKSTIEIESAHKKNALLVPFTDNSSLNPITTSNEELSIINIESNIINKSNNNLYNSIPSEEIEKSKTLNYLSKQNGHVVVVSDLDKARNKELILSKIPEAKFLKVDNAGMFKANSLEESLSKNKLNYVILDSDKTIIFLKSTTALMSKLSEYNIQLVILESSLLPEKTEVSDMRYRVLKLIFPVAIGPKTNNTPDVFERKYQDWFDVKPSRHAIIGFNVTLDIILRLSQNSSFEKTINTIVSEHPHIKFDYQKIDNSKYLNSGVYLYQYDTNDGLIKLE